MELEGNYPLSLVTHIASQGKKEKDRRLDPRLSVANAFASHNASARPLLPFAGGQRGPCPTTTDVAHGRWISMLGGRWRGCSGGRRRKLVAPLPHGL
jgi:hypothetical protein